MTTGATGQLGLALPVQGELSGTWGDTVNNGITQYTNIAIAGTLTLTGDGAVTLANTTGDASASNITSTLAGAGTVTAQFAIVQVSGTTTTKVVTGPSYSKTYVVDNASSYAVTFKASGQTGVSIAAAEKVTVVFNGTDYIKLAGTIANAAGSNTQIQFNNGGLFGASANLTWDGTTLSSTQVNITGQGTLRLQDTTGGEYVGLRAPASLGASYTLTWPADDGTNGQALVTDGSGTLSWSTAASGDVYGPGSSTDNAVARFDGTTGKLLQDSVVIVGDTGAVTGVTDLTTTGNTILGNASTDTVQVNGYMGVGGAGSSNIGLYVRNTALTGTTQYGVSSTVTGNSAATSNIIAIEGAAKTAAETFTSANVQAFYASDVTKGAGSTITNQHGIRILDQTQGTNNYGITSLVSSGTNKWNVYASGTAANYFAGVLNVGTTTLATGIVTHIVGTTRIANSSGGALQLEDTDVADGSRPFQYIQSDTGSLIFGNANRSGTATTNSTERLRIDSSGNVGIGTSSPSQALTVSGGNILLGNDYNLYFGGTNTFVSGNITGNNIKFGIGGSEQMRLTSTGLGIGTSSPNYVATLYKATLPVLQLANSTSGSTSTDGLLIYLNGSNAMISNQETGYLAFETAGTTRAIIDSAGNLGLGVTPSAWWGSARGFDIASVGAMWSGAGVNVGLLGNAYFGSAVDFRYKTTAAATRYDQSGGGHAWYNAPSGTAGNAISFTQAMTLDASGKLQLGTTTADGMFTMYGNYQSYKDGTYTGYIGKGSNVVASGGAADFGIATNSGNILFATGGSLAERARIDSSGNLLIGTTTNPVGAGNTVSGIVLRGSGIGYFSANTDYALSVARNSDDGELVRFYQGGTQEGDISVSGTTVSYNGGHLSRYAQTTIAKDDSIVKGTVLSNLDEMNVYTKDGQPVANEQLNKVKVSDTEGDVNVAGVFVNWIHDEDHNVDEINMAMTGDMIIRIAQGVTVVRGDLLMSAGDGTAKPQGDDIIRSKTVAKVTSNHVTCTYADGSYCVPCVLMAC